MPRPTESTAEPARRAALPVPLTSLVGRERELATVCQLLRHPELRLLTLTGPGGVGKTRLALQAAAGVAGDFADGLAFISLAALDDAAQVIPALARGLDLRQAGRRSTLQQLGLHLQDRQMLLVLDNFEQVVDAAPGVAELLAGCPDLKVLATSREALRVRGEHEFAVPLLTLPDLQRITHLTASLARVVADNPAVALFVERVRAARPDFQLTDENALAVAEICTRLDGLPLALELAAARANALPPPALLARLASGGSLQVLTRGARDLPARQKTLRSTIQWSYDLLDAEEQAVFRRLAVFAGGLGLEAAAAICGGAAGEADSLVLALADKSLLQLDPADRAHRGGPRLSMLAAVREFGLGRLEAAGEAEETHERHAQYCLALAEAGALHLSGPEQEQRLDALEADHDNLRAALRWFLGRQAAESALRLASALSRFWALRGYLSEGRDWLHRGLQLESSEQAPPALRARALASAALLAQYQGDIPQAVALCDTSLALFRSAGDEAGLTEAVQTLAQALMRGGRLAEAQAAFEDSLARSRAAGDRWGIAHALVYLGLIEFQRGNHGAARPLIEEGLGLHQALGDPQAIAQALQALGWTRLGLEDLAAARSAFLESLPICQRTGDRAGLGRSLCGLGEVDRRQGDLALARLRLDEAVTVFIEVGDRYHLSACLGILAGWAADAGQYERGAQFAGAFRVVMGPIFVGVPHYFRLRIDETLSVLQAKLAEVAFESARAAGAELASAGEWEKLLAAPEPEPASRSGTPGGLTEREIEVLRLLAQGLSNPQIAERLVVSLFTVKAHLRSIFGKLGVTTRTAAARRALDLKLV